MKTLFLLAVNWDARGTDEQRHFCVDVLVGNDLAGIFQNCKYDDGWRVYAFATKRERDAQARNIL